MAIRPIPRRRIALAAAAVCTGMFATPSWAASALELEAAMVFPGYNDVAVPGDTGTRLSLTSDLTAQRTRAFRLRVSHAATDRHWFGLLAAPLTARSNGTLRSDVDFDGTRFAAGDSVEATFQFDSYRAIYRYLWLNSDAFHLHIGGALKIRDAAIRLASRDGKRATKSNVGLVPLLSFRLSWPVRENTRMFIDGEALAAPQGRAEDVLFAIERRLNRQWTINAGYRLLEGGADNDEVYTFSLFNYLVLGAAITF